MLGSVDEFKYLTLLFTSEGRLEQVSDGSMDQCGISSDVGTPIRCGEERAKFDGDGHFTEMFPFQKNSIVDTSEHLLLGRCQENSQDKIERLSLLTGLGMVVCMEG